MKKIYVADDEEDILLLHQCFLKKEGYLVETFKCGEELLQRFSKEEADLLIIDGMMPGMSGFELCEKVREKSEVPIIILTARDSDVDLISGFSKGCDDYFTKPFSPLKLTLRANAIFSRMKEKEPESIEYGDISIHLLRKMVLIQGQEAKATSMEFELLLYMITNKGRAVSREELLAGIWGYETQVETRATDDIIKRLRKKLKEANSNVK